MIKFVLVLLFFLWTFWLRPEPVGDSLTMRLVPFTPPLTLGLDTALFLVAAVGMCFAALMGLVDQYVLKRHNRRLAAEAAALRAEVTSLRSIMTTEREEE